MPLRVDSANVYQTLRSLLRLFLRRCGFDAGFTLSNCPKSRMTSVRSTRGSRQESSMFRRIPWQDVCKFLAGAFFVSAGVLFYLYLARVSVPLLGTGFIETPEVSGLPYIVNAVLFVAFFYPRFHSKVENAKPQRLTTQW